MAPILPSFPVRNLVCVCVASLAFLAGAKAVRAQDAAPVPEVRRLVVRAAEHKDFDRIVFDIPRGVPYVIQRDGTAVKVHFSLQASVDTKATARLARVKGFVAQTGNGEGKDKLLVTFNVSPNATVKDMMSGPSVVIDVYGPSAEEQAQAKEQPKEKPKEQVKTQTPQKPEPAKTEPPKETLTAEPSPGTTKLAKTELPKQEQEKPLLAESPKQEETPPAPAASAPSTPAPAVNPPAEQPPEQPEAPPAPTKPLELGAKPELVATMDPKMPVGVAIFARGGFGTILFDRKLTVDPVALTSGSPLKIKLEPINLVHNNGWGFEIPENTEVRATRAGTAWKIYLVRKTDEAAVSTNFIAQPDFALGARILLPINDAPNPIRYTDPIVGDELIVIPLQNSTAFSIKRRMADFVVIPAAQGVVIKPLHEKVTVRTFAEGIEITAEGGLKLSPAVDTGSTPPILKKTAKGKSNRQIFDLVAWKGRPGEDFTTTRQKLTQTVIDVPESQRNLARLELARFYFANGMGEEALALMGVLARQTPDIEGHPEFLALRGAIRILVGHASEGLKDLSDPSLENQPEITLWQAVGAAQVRDWTAAEEKFNYTEELWNAYPEPFRTRFSILAIESALSLDKDREAAEWLDRLEIKSKNDESTPAMKYLRGVLQSKSGRADQAEKLWREVAKSNDRLYKIRAELALIDLGVATKSTTPAQAVERLEGLRYAWRGDDLELDILRRLGGFHVEAKNYKVGLAAMQQAVRLYPHSSLTPPIKAEMAKIFHDLYMTDLGENLSPVDALTMYNEYRDLIPAGQEGNALKRNLAERLVQVDLLEQAANLLEEQLKNGLKGEERMRIGARLAAIRLLDHKPDVAIAALEMSQADMPAGDSTNEILAERRLLRARAVSEKGKYDDALLLLQGEDGKNANILRADITMKAQRWPEAAKVLQELVGSPPKAGYQLTEEQAGWLVNEAIALSLSNDTTGLDKLAIDYGPAMAGTAQRDTFRVLTRPEKDTQMKDIAAAQAKISEVDMFRGFLDAYRGAPKTEKKENKPK